MWLASQGAPVAAPRVPAPWCRPCHAPPSRSGGLQGVSGTARRAEGHKGLGSACSFGSGEAQKRRVCIAPASVIAEGVCAQGTRPCWCPLPTQGHQRGGIGLCAAACSTTCVVQARRKFPQVADSALLLCGFVATTNQKQAARNSHAIPSARAQGGACSACACARVHVRRRNFARAWLLRVVHQGTEGNQPLY